MTKTKWLMALAIAIPLIAGSCSNAVEYTGDSTKLYSISVYPKPAHGEIKLSHNKLQSGNIVKVYALPDSGYVLEEGSLTYLYRGVKNAQPEQIPKSNTYYYQWPISAYDSEVTATFIPNTDSARYTVSIDKTIANGFIVPDIAISEPGTVVTLNIFPSTGYVLDASSFTIKDAAGTVLYIPISSSLPYTFSQPASNVIVSAAFGTADFNGLLQNAQSYLQDGQYDTAASYYEEAYKKRSQGSPEAVNEVIFYHSLGKLGSILLNNRVRELLSTGKGRLHFQKIPISLDDWICDSESGWPGSDNDRWYDTWNGIDYSINEKSEKGYVIDENPPLWQPITDVTEEITIPKLEYRFGVDRIESASGGFGGSFADYSFFYLNRNKQGYFNALFWLMLSQQREDGFNLLLEKIEERVFGSKGSIFEEAASLAALLPADAEVTLYPNLIRRFELGKYYGTINPNYDPNDPNEPRYVVGEVKAGKAELDYIFGVLRAVKAAIQYLRAYDWTTNVRPWLIDDIKAEYGLDQVLHEAFTLGRNDNYYKPYWASTKSIAGILPLKNRFMETRNASFITSSKNEFLTALNMINSSMDYWHGSSGSFSADGKANYAWAKNAFAQAKNAINGQNTGNFDFPKKLPKPGEAWPAAGNGDYAINTAKFFTAGTFNLRNLLTVESGSIPSMFKIPWYPSADYTDATLLPEQATLVTGPIPDDDSERVEGKNVPYMLYSFEINTGNLRAIFPRGFEQTKYSPDANSGHPSGPNGTKAFFYQVFPTIPLWPERPTYLIGPGYGDNKSAQDLYQYYHK